MFSAFVHKRHFNCDLNRSKCSGVFDSWRFKVAVVLLCRISFYILLYIIIYLLRFVIHLSNQHSCGNEYIRSMQSKSKLEV